jgi:hypothetical protein
MIEVGVLYLVAHIIVWMIIAILAMLGLAVICGIILSGQISREEEAAELRRTFGIETDREEGA